ncbi:hypothetical protein Bca4012_039446 [Brassica carinata]
MVLDTGSELSWLYCKQSSTSTTPIFDHAKSSSYIAIPCSSPVCTTQTQDLPAPATCDKQANLCHVAVSYVDGSSLDGNLAKETFGIGSWTRPAMVFGCMDSSSSDAETITGSTKPDFSKLPTVSLMFRGAELTVSGEKLLYQVPGLGSDQKYCFTFGNSDLAGFEVFIIGNVHQQNVWMEYDIANAQVGFANDVRCDQASQLL